MLKCGWNIKNEIQQRKYIYNKKIILKKFTLSQNIKTQRGVYYTLEEDDGRINFNGGIFKLDINPSLVSFIIISVSEK